MGMYAIGRLGYYASIFFAIVAASFILFHMVPSDPARSILGPSANERQVAQFRQTMGLDQPVHVQMMHYVKKIAQFDFGQSHIDGRDIRQEILARLKVTLLLSVLSMMIVFLYLFLVLSTLPTRLSPIFGGIGFLISSLPVFFSGVMVAMGTVYYYPVTTFTGNFSISDWLYLLPPATVLSLYPMAILAGILKSEFNNQWNAPYIVSETALGFSAGTLLYKYFAKNAILPVLAALSSMLPIYLTGAFIVEIIFSLPGLSSVIVKSVMEQDLPMLEAAVIVNGLCFVSINFMFECLHPLIDPRIIKGGRS